ncbi:hypothetical protein Tco_0920878 [Tanacetum coccineum]
MGEINKCFPIKVNGRINYVRTSEDHNRSILLNNPDEDDDSDGISETEVRRNSEEAPLNDDHWEVVKKDKFDSFSHVSPTYDLLTRRLWRGLGDVSQFVNDDLNSNFKISVYGEWYIRNDILEAPKRRLKKSINV